jgi:FtsP/CotA-like multicopper oxidase with cupredoxin domain
MPEGLYWYHPHVHGEVQAQMLMGLSGVADHADNGMMAVLRVLPAHRTGRHERPQTGRPL